MNEAEDYGLTVFGWKTDEMLDVMDRKLDHLINSVKNKYEVLRERLKTMAGEIKKFADEVNARFDEIGTAVDGVVDDVAYLKQKIDELQNNPGPISPEDQAILNDLQARVNVTADKLKALDSATERPPTPPPA